QTTFLNAFRGLQRGTTTRFEQAWLYKIAQNVCIARRSSSGRRLKLETPDDFEVLQELVPAGNAPADGDTLELIGLDTALDSMPENQRRAILMREWQGLSYREISSELGLSQGAVEMLIFRARRTLATALEQPDAGGKRTKSDKARTGFSFGSLIAAMKSLFSGTAALKMAAVAVSAAVVGTNAAVHTVVHPVVVRHHHTKRTSLAPPVARIQAAPATAMGPEPAQLVSLRTAPHRFAPATSSAGPQPSGGTAGHAPVLVLDTPAPPTQQTPAAAPPPSPGDATSTASAQDASSPAGNAAPPSSSVTSAPPGGGNHSNPPPSASPPSPPPAPKAPTGGSGPSSPPPPPSPPKPTPPPAPVTHGPDAHDRRQADKGHGDGKQR
ncbi:MAG: RNA polymerase sigma factor, partial [Gaiellaceae bacterium]